MTQARNEAGFSLVEVLVATVILGVGLVGVTQGFTASLSASKATEHQTKAVMLADSHLEELMMSPWLEAGERTGESDVYPTLRWRETIKETKSDGLYEIELVVERKADGDPVYRLTTLRFVMPLDTGETEEDRRERFENARRPDETGANG